MSNSSRAPLPPPVALVLDKLGADIKSARLRRRIRAATIAERARISRTTLHKIERGAAGVSIGKYASVLHVLGFHAGMGDLADRSRDKVGLDMLEESLPKRVRIPRKAG
ncbi:MAG: helix-turn-helix transcriptional regulator [Gemmatimonadetes bacterium]|nr:helix-turn-helix transcriptional regulator [Gemmatimonadota bacterium]